MTDANKVFSKEHGLAYSGRRRLLRMNPVWILMLVNFVLASVCLFLLLNSGIDRLVVGFLAGLFLCVSAGLALAYWCEKELRD